MYVIVGQSNSFSLQFMFSLSFDVIGCIQFENVQLYCFFAGTAL